MKKILKSFLFAAIALFTFASCEDVPAPYLLPIAGGPEPELETIGDGTWANPYTASDAVALAKANKCPDVDVFVKGIISSVGVLDRNGNLTDLPGGGFGNASYFISDDGTPVKQLEIYRGYGLDGVNFTSEDDLKVGDDVIVYGKLSLYGSTPEMSQGSKLYKHNDTVIEPVELGESKGSGTFEDPYNVPAAIRICERLEKSTVSTSYTSETIYVHGFVAEVITEGNNAWSEQYGNITYYISEDGTTANKLMVYRGLGLDGEKFTSQDALKPGDEVIVVGKLVNFNGTFEFTTGNKLVKLNDKVITPPDYSNAQGDGTEINPYNPTAALQICSTLEETTNNAEAKTTDEVFIKGMIVKIETEGTNAFNPQYGNLTYYIVDEGQQPDEGKYQNQLLVYRGMYVDGDPFASANALETGDVVVIAGKLVNFRGTFEVTQGSRIVSINGIAPTPSGPDIQGDPTGTGTQSDPYNVCAAMQLIRGLQKTTSTSDQHTSSEVYVKGIITKIDNIDTGTYGNATYFIGDKDAAGATLNELEIYRGLYLNGAKFTNSEQIKLGDEVVIVGKLVNFKGTYEVTQGSQIYTINGSTEPGGGDTPTTGDDEAISIEENIVTITNPTVAPLPGDAGTTYDLGEILATETNAAVVTEITPDNNVVITFDKGTGTSDAKYYSGTKGVRMYGGNTITITSNNNKAIAKVVLQCDKSNTVAYTGCNAKRVNFGTNSMTLTNSGTNTTQLRIQTITIFFGE